MPLSETDNTSSSNLRETRYACRVKTKLILIRCSSKNTGESTDSPMPEIALVSSAKTKRDEPTAPKELYTSDYFDKMRSYTEQYHDDWWILSAIHGLIDPDSDPIEPYDESLNGARVTTKRERAEGLVEKLDQEDAYIDKKAIISQQ
jgi:hypothetical protein